MTEHIYLPGQFTSLSPSFHLTPKLSPKSSKLKISTLQYWPSWCWRCVGCRPPRCICCKLGPETWRRARGSSPDWLLRGVGIILPPNTSRVTCSLSTYSCAPRRWWGRRCSSRASRQGRRPCGAAAPVSARGSHHTRSSRGQGLGSRGIK